LDIELNALLERVKSGDDAAFDLLCEKYSTLIKSSVRRFAPSLGIDGEVRTNDAAADLDELNQDMKMTLYKAAVTYDADESKNKVSFGLYAKICMNNAMISKVRSYKRTLKRLEKLKNNVSTEHQHRKYEADMAFEGLSYEELSDSLKKAVDSLSKYERQVFDLYIAGKFTKEIALELNRTEKSVGNACYRVKMKIKDLLKN